MANDEAIKILKQKGEALLAQPRKRLELTGLREADDFLNDLKSYPHAFVLGCIMDRRVRWKRVWRIPYVISKEAGGREFSKFLRLGLKKIQQVFVDQKLHVWNVKMSNCFWLATKRIHDEYRDDASLIWKGNPKSGTVVRKFLRFKGVGLKIASMATNILVRDFNIPMADKHCIDISPDRHVKRVFYRLDLIENENDDVELTYCARELNPEYPGIFDLDVWRLGEQGICSPQKPKCKECYLNPYCPKKGVSEG